MKKRTIALLCAAAIMLAGCAGSDADGSTPASANGTESRVTIDTPNGEYGFTFDLLENSYALDTSNMEKITTYEYSKVVRADIDGVYEFNYSLPDLDYYSKREALGKAYLGDAYDSSCWEIKKVSNTKELSAQYQSLSSSESMTANNSGVFFYRPDSEAPFASTWIGELIEDNDDAYKLTDKSSITYKEAVKIAEEAFKPFNEVIDKGKAFVPTVSYNEGRAMIRVDYQQQFHGLLKCWANSANTQYSSEKTDGLGVRSAAGDITKSVYIYSSADKGYYIRVLGTSMELKDIQKYDRLITLQSALEYLDTNLAPNMDMILKSANLRYLLTTEVGEKDADGSYVAMFKTAIPVWEIILYNRGELQDYAYVLNVLNGEYSLVKLKPNN